jgi:hypothetical protein
VVGFNEEPRDVAGFFFDANGGEIMITLKVVFWLLAIPCILILIGVIWLWLLSLIGRGFTGGGK